MKNTILETILLTDGYKLDHRRQYPDYDWQTVFDNEKLHVQEVI